MAQPTIVELLGAGTVIDIPNQLVSIPAQVFIDNGLIDLSTAQPIEIVAVLVKNATSWLTNNNDEAVNADGNLTVNTPAIRNNIEKTLFAFTFEFFGNYTEPIFNPIDL